MWLRFKPYKGVSSNSLRTDMKEQVLCFKPYKGVSSNLSFHLVCQRVQVSNPIREYLQILKKVAYLYESISFKPYKGVSSNHREYDEDMKLTRFKPYKGVSSNHRQYQVISSSQGVSNPIREYLQMR